MTADTAWTDPAPKAALALADAAARDALRAVLEDDGFEVSAFAGAEEMLALDAAGRPRPLQLARLAPMRIILVEVGTTPRALDAISLLKADARTRAVPVATLAQNASEALIYECIKAGAVDHFILPVEPHALLDRVNRLLGRETYDPSRDDAATISMTLPEFLRKELRRTDRERAALSLVYCVVEEQQHAGWPGDSPGDAQRRGAYERQRERVIAAATDAVRSALREADTVVRQGGLDFVAVLPMTDTHVCWRVAEKIRAAFVDACRRDARSDRVVRDLRIGYATYPRQAGNEHELLALARKAARQATAPTPSGEEEVLEYTHTFCPVCGARFPRAALLPSAARLIGRDSDLMPLYEGESPLFYQVIVCPACFYSAFEDDYHAIDDEARRRIAAMGKLLRTIAAGTDFGGRRPPTTAARAFLLAGECYKRRGGAPARIAAAYHHAARVFRQLGDTGRDKQLLREALRHYAAAQHSSTLPGLAANQAELLYIIGDLCQRLGDMQTAARCFQQAHRRATAPQPLPPTTEQIAQLAKKRLEEIQMNITE